MAQPYLALRPAGNGLDSHNVVAGSKNPTVLTVGVSKDDNKSEYGGIGHVGETLEEFIAEVGLSADTAMRHVNVALKQCGIEPIPYN